MVGYAVVVLLVLDGPEVLFRHESALYTLGWADMFWWCLSQPSIISSVMNFRGFVVHGVRTHYNSFRPRKRAPIIISRP
jgi:hypothetical protein